MAMVTINAGIDGFWENIIDVEFRAMDAAVNRK
jgi:hypothetical protein